MAEPNTTNIGLVIPNNGDLIGTWGSQALNPDMVAIDGLLAGIVTVSLSSAPITLTAPSGSITATPGPSQSQNAIINLTGVLSANVQVTLPLPGVQRIANFTTGNFVVTLAARNVGQVVGVSQGAVTEVFNDGTNVKFLNAGFPGELKFVAGPSSGVPSWMAACTVRPWLYCDGTVYNSNDFPGLSSMIAGSFGGDGSSTFAVPDLRGRVPVAYDGTGTRMTVAGSGINGQVIGAAGGEQSHVLGTPEIPAHTHQAFVSDPGHAHGTNAPINNNGQLYLNGGGGGGLVHFTGSNANTDVRGTGVTVSNANAGGGLAHNNVQPSLVSGIWLVKT